VICVIQLQKRGLPHVYIQIILENDFKPEYTNVTDPVISAEISISYNMLIKLCMVYGSCGDLTLQFPLSPVGDIYLKRYKQKCVQ
jgi:hypothetical protein